MSFAKLLAHVGHEIEIATYGLDGGTDIVHNVAVECLDCCVVLVDFNNPEMNEPDPGLEYPADDKS